jgi:hypothetical protein
MIGLNSKENSLVLMTDVVDCREEVWDPGSNRTFGDVCDCVAQRKEAEEDLCTTISFNDAVGTPSE